MIHSNVLDLPKAVDSSTEDLNVLMNNANLFVFVICKIQIDRLRLFPPLSLAVGYN